MNRTSIILGVVLVSCLGDFAARAEQDWQQALDEAEVIYRTDGPEAALPRFESLAGQIEIVDLGSKSRAVGFVGEIHWRMGNYEAAAKHLEQALKFSRQANDRLREGRTLNVLGLLSWDLGNFDQAMQRFSSGAEIATELGENRLAGAILNNLSLVHDELGEYDVSMSQYRRVLELYEGQDFARGVGDTLGNLGGVYLLLGRFEEALEHYRQALAISEQLGSTISMSQDHGNIGLCLLGLGQVDAALTQFEQAADLAEGAGMQQDQAYWLRASGNALMLKGRHDLGLERHRAALAIYEQIDSGTERAEALYDAGRLQLLLGDAATAEDYFDQALELARAFGLTRGISAGLIALGDLQLRQDAPEAAVALYSQATARARESSELAQLSGSLLRESQALRHLQRYEEAGKKAAQALDLARDIGAPGLEARALYSLAELQRRQGRMELALVQYNESIVLLSRTPNVELEWRARHGLGLGLAETGQLGEAISSLKEAIKVIESVRNRLQQDRFRSGYVQDKYQVYVDLVRLQLQASQFEAAFFTAERLRARSYLDLLDNGRAPDPSVEDQVTEYALRERIRVLRDALAEEHGLSRVEQRQPAIRVYSRELLAAEQAFQAYLDEQRLESTVVGETTIPSFTDISQALMADEALVEYVVGDQHLMAFVLTGDELFAEVIDMRRVDLENKVELARNLIRRRDGGRWEKPVSSLARAILDPVIKSGQLDRASHLYVVPHGILNYLPFSLLPGRNGNERRIIEDYTIAYLPSAAALLQESNVPGGDASMLAMAPASSRLKYAGAEALAVDALFARNSLALVGSSATETVFKREAANFQLLHLATHGYFNKLNPLLSGLELEADGVNDGRLEVHEILELNLGAELVTLSACQTGLGSGHFAEIPAGDDFVGLTRAFLSAGSNSVLATLWEVDDASTADLMERFYRALRDDPVPDDRATALALAQRAFLASENHRHPYYWAPFVLVGDLGHSARNPG